jgi:hypothetical protein
MKRPLLWIIAVVVAGAIAAAPALNEVCRLDCAIDRLPECPLHQKAPRRCLHDCTIGVAGLTRASVETSPPVDAAIAVTAYRVTLEPASAGVFLVEHSAPSLRSLRSDVLRI